MDLVDLLFESLHNLIQEGDIGTIIYSAITVIITIMEFFGTTFPEMKLKGKDFKNKNAIEYVIVDSVKDESIKSFCRKTGVFYLEVFLVLLDKLIMLIPIGSFCILADGIAKGRKIYWYLIVFLIASIVIGILMYVVDKKVSEKVRKVYPLILAIGISIFSIIILIIIRIKSLLFFLIGISTLLILGAVIYFLQKIDWYKDYDNEDILNCCRIIRYILLGMETVYFLVQIEYAVNQDSVVSQVIYGLVLFLASVEYIVINRKDKNSYANIILHMNDGEDKVTKEKVIQYYGEKIKVNLIDGTEELLNFEQIKNISYRRNNLLLKKSTSQNNVKCILKNGEVQGFSFYQLKNDKWIMFSKSENGVKDVIFIKSDDVIKVEEQKKVL